MSKGGVIKDVLKATLLVVFGTGFLIIFAKIALHGHHVALEPNPAILCVEMLAAGFAIILGLEALWKTGGSLSESLKKWMISRSSIAGREGKGKRR
ncbi:MAG: hypothetical protein QMC89_01560 [Candidatus Hodarchaeaceae archaeon]|nr:hypothetical protein [Candidatus Hodarchaeaceae archaeon]